MQIDHAERDSFHLSRRTRLARSGLRLLRVFLAAMPLARVRAMTRGSTMPMPAGIRVEPARGIPARWVLAGDSSAGPTVVYLHGGGYCQDSPGMHLPLVGRIIQPAAGRGLYLDYRLAPEHPFPAALDDTDAAYSWLLAQGISPAQIVLAGDSAGGGLAVALMLRLRDEKRPLPAGAVLISPWLDLTLETPSARADRDPSVGRTTLARYARMYAGTHALDHPLISPLNADLRGLPPLCIQAGGAEIFRDEAQVFARRAADAGVPVDLQLYPGLWHDFQIMPPRFVPEVQPALEAIARFFSEHISIAVRHTNPK